MRKLDAKEFQGIRGWLGSCADQVGGEVICHRVGVDPGKIQESPFTGESACYEMCEHIQVLLTNLLVKRWEWQEDRKGMPI